VPLPDGGFAWDVLVGTFSDGGYLFPDGGLDLILLNKPRVRSAVAVSGTKIFVFGGSLSFQTATNSGEYYDVSVPFASWVPTSPASISRQGLTAVTLPNGKIRVFGGEDASSCLVGTVEEYDPATDSWTAITQ
jgi:hypothetical protein